MRKYFCASLVLAVVILFSGCGQASLAEVAKNSISELHMNYFSGSTQNFKLSMWSGLREEPYTIDGVKNDLVQFCVLNIVPAVGFDAQAVEYTAEINGQAVSGVFERSPFDKSFASDLKLSLADNDEIFVYLILNGETEIARMECISQNFSVTNSQAIDIAVAHFSQNSATVERFLGDIEGYCQIVSTDKALEIYFWYVSFVNSKNERIAVIVDPSTGEIVAEG